MQEKMKQFVRSINEAHGEVHPVTVDSLDALISTLAIDPGAQAVVGRVHPTSLCPNRCGHEQLTQHGGRKATTYLRRRSDGAAAERPCGGRTRLRHLSPLNHRPTARVGCGGFFMPAGAMVSFSPQEK